jgi:NtrC-family two-component system sensor histidine kinase KinB
MIGLMCLIFPLALYVIYHFAQRVDVLVSEDMQASAASERIVQLLDVEITQAIASMLTPASAGTEDDEGSRNESARQALHEAIDAAHPYFLRPAEREALADVEQRYVHFQNALSIWRAGQMSHSGVAELPRDFAQLREAIVRMRQIKNAGLGEATSLAREFAHEQIAFIGVVALLAMLLGLFATLRLVRSITGPADQLTALVQSMGQGDFEIAFHDGSIDEFNALGRHFEAVGKALRLFRATNLERIVVEQRRTEAVLDSIGDGLVIFSEDGIIERINAVAERQLGIESGQAGGKRFEDIGDVQTGLRVKEVLATGEFAVAGEPEILIERDGETRILGYWLNRFVETESGRPGVVMVMRDITTQREFDKMRSDFVLRASHELRTPITSIRMGLGMLAEKIQFPPGSRDEELYQTVQQELARMVALLADLLDLSRLRVGEQKLERAPTLIDDVLTQTRQRFALAATEAGIALNLDVEAGLPRLSLCRNAFDRVLDNLISNALRHTPEGGSIMLSAHRAAQRVAIAVADTGPGIPYAQQALIFQPFVQIGTKVGGAGLGLAICKEIVHQHGGEIRVSSLPRRGTTFTILLSD